MCRSEPSTAAASLTSGEERSAYTLLSAVPRPESSEMMLPNALLGLFFLGQLKIDDFNEAHPAHASGLAGPVFDIKDLFDSLEGFSLFHQGLNPDLLFFDALNMVLDVFLRSQVAMAVNKDLRIQIQNGL